MADKRQLCKIGKNAEIVFDGKCFTLRFLEGGSVVDEFNFSWIADALRAYVLYSLNKVARIEPSVSGLVKKVDNLSALISSVGCVLGDEWRKFVNDPVEKVIEEEDTRNEDE
ncbi:MAG: hypothetical protein WC444_05310 [Candidatus Paceibacterota bacterium]